MRKALLGLPIVVVVVVVALLATPFLATCGGHDEAVTDLIRKCDRATKLIGSDAHPARMGFACGSTSISGDSGNASWSLPFTGENGRGTVSFRAIKENDEWRVLGATLDAGDEEIDLVACAGGPIVGRGFSGTFEGRVTSSTHESIRSDMHCKGTIERKTGEDLADVAVTCADNPSASEGTVVYRGRSTAKLDMGTSAKDDETLEYNDTAGPVNTKIEMKGGKGSLRVWSQSPAWEIVTEL